MKLFCVISHTHWDREWYMPLELMKLRLVDLIDRCLVTLHDYPEYIFHLDAQTVVLEDYLSVRPGNRELLQKYVREGRLVIGPWYLQNDFYLTSGEATVRNLIEGHKIATEFGNCCKVGYAPDQFGNISQLPQILADFGIHNFICGRGYCKHTKDENDQPVPPKPVAEFEWKGADGTSALAIYMPFWYNNAQRFSADIEKAKHLAEVNEKMFQDVAHTPYLLLMNGVDHLEAQDDLLPILEQINHEFDDDHVIKQYRMDDYVRQVEEYLKENDVKLTSYQGELRHGHDWQILQGTLSSRVYLKQANVKAQDMLECKLEPLYSMMELAGMKGVYSLDHFRYMWKDLMKNHPHDSICGCSRDEIHKHMEDNFERLSDTSNEILRRGMVNAAEHMATNGFSDENFILLTANTTESAQSGVVEAYIDIPKSDGYQGIEIFDHDGNPVQFGVISKQDFEKDVFSPINLPGHFPTDRYHIYLYVENIHAFSFKGYIVKNKKQANELMPMLTDTNAAIENERFKVTVDANGCISFSDKNTGRVYHDLLDFEEIADPGDSYVFFTSDEPASYASAYPAKVTVTEKNNYAQTLEITRTMQIPAEYDFAAKKRSFHLVPLTLKLSLTLKKGAQQLEIGYTFENTAKDHRVRLIVNSGILTDAMITDIPFDLVSHTDEDIYCGTMSKVLPNTTLAALENKEAGMAVFTEGTHETEHFSNQGKVAFTLVRSTGVINRVPGSLEEGGGEVWRCPANQCLRALSGRFGVTTFNSGEKETLPRKSKAYRIGLLTQLTACDRNKFMTGRTAVQDSMLEEFFFLPDPYQAVQIPDNTPLVSVCGNNSYVTALKKAERGDGIILRILNTGDTTDEVTVKADASFFLTSMSEAERDYASNQVFTEEMGPKKIRTMLLQ